MKTKILHNKSEATKQFSPMYETPHSLVIPPIHSYLFKLHDLIWNHMFSYEKHLNLLLTEITKEALTNIKIRKN